MGSWCGGAADVPELPEVETTRRGISPLVVGRKISKVSVRERRLRQPVPRNIAATLTGQILLAVERRSKYLLFCFDNGTLIVHLGMSGSLRIVEAQTTLRKHDHVEIRFGEHLCLRLHDPRRFGLMVWTRESPSTHALLNHLGPEPWDEEFTPEYLHESAKGRKLAVKNFIMDGRIVVGVGNIYASESLHRAGIHPSRAAGRVSKARFRDLITSVQAVLEEALTVGGTTLRDFVKSDGEPGYFALELKVYGRAGDPCRGCGAPIRCVVIGQRSSFYCPLCQR